MCSRPARPRLWTFLCAAALTALTAPPVVQAAAPAEALAPAPVPTAAPLYPDVHLGGLLQPQALLEQDRPGERARTLRFMPFVRRARLAVHGRLQPGLNFFVQLDVPNTGLRNDWTPRFFLNDLLLEFEPTDWLQIDVGLLLLPTSHAAASATPLSLGVNAPQVFFSQEVTAKVDDLTVFPSQQAMRDAGLMARGQVPGTGLEFRLALTTGLSKFVGTTEVKTAVNPHAIPRLTGRLVWSFFEQVAGPTFRGFFYPGVVLQQEGERLISPKRLFNLGLSASYQPDAIATGGTDTADFGLLNGDIFFDFPLGDGQQALSGQVDYAVYRLGPDLSSLRHVVFAEVGYRYHRFGPVAAIEAVKNRATTEGDTLYPRLGLAWWLAGHTANIKLDAGARRQIKAGDPSVFLFIGHLATQFFF